MEIEHRDRKRLQNAESLCKKTEFYKVTEAALEEQLKVRTGFPFLSKKQFDELPLLRHVERHYSGTIPKPSDDVVQKVTGLVGFGQPGDQIGSVGRR